MAAYATVADARQEGVPNTITPEMIQPKLDHWSKFIDAATKQWFEPRAMSIFLDGNDSRTLFLPVPIIQLDALYMNNNFITPLDPKLYAAYNRRDELRDDRRNPMVKLAGSGLGVFDSPDLRCGAMFLHGEQNQRLDGVFGFVESDGTTPSLIKRAVLKMTIKDLMGGTLWSQAGGSGTPAGGGLILSETTDGHTVTYHAFSVTPSKPGLNGITNDQEVDRIIDLYKGPWKMTSTPGRGGPDRRW